MKGNEENTCKKREKIQLRCSSLYMVSEMLTIFFMEKENYIWIISLDNVLQTINSIQVGSSSITLQLECGTIVKSKPAVRI